MRLWGLCGFGPEVRRIVSSPDFRCSGQSRVEILPKEHDSRRRGAGQIERSRLQGRVGADARSVHGGRGGAVKTLLRSSDRLASSQPRRLRPPRC